MKGAAALRQHLEKGNMAISLRYTCPACRARTFSHAAKRALCAQKFGSKARCPRCGQAVCISEFWATLLLQLVCVLSIPVLLVGFLAFLELGQWVGLELDGFLFYAVALLLIGVLGAASWFVYCVLAPLKVAEKQPR